VTSSAERSLRIAQIAPVATAVRAGVGESVEQMVSLLTEELVRRGHDVTLFATGDSQTTARLSSLYPLGYEHDPADPWDWGFRESMHASTAYVRQDEFDVIHAHNYHYGLPAAQFVRKPQVHTHHVEMSPDVIDSYWRHPQIHFVALSNFQRAPFDGRANVEVIPPGIDTAAFPLGKGGSYLLFLGRMIADKGPADAVEVARRAGMPLVLAGPAEEGFDDHVAPLVDGREITYVGRVEPPDRDRLLAGAAALVFPLRYPEPFGLVMVEAMACGTPVLGTRTGAVAEIVEHGATGYVADSWEGLPELVPSACSLDRARIRARAAERFDFQRMVDEHEQLYLRMVADHEATAR
jgi:glycosyltransferase involved in cell wall biosynthesis